MKLDRAAALLRLELSELKSDGPGAKAKVAKAFRDLSIEFHPDKNKSASGGRWNAYEKDHSSTLLSAGPTIT